MKHLFPENFTSGLIQSRWCPFCKSKKYRAGHHDISIFRAVWCNRRNKKGYLVIGPVLFFVGICLLNAGCSQKLFREEFAGLPEKGLDVPISGMIGIDQNGGHLQGIQMYLEGEIKYIFLSGSSSEVAFMIRAEIDQKARVLSADTLMVDPYRHAGGFQIFGHYLAVGIEDNHLRTTSRVVVYDLDKEEATWSDPIQIIYRDGGFERVSAGAVGMTGIKGHLLIAVANWDSRNLDFYLCPEDKLAHGNDNFKLKGSLEMNKASRKNWSDSIWYAYQNINLFTVSGNRVYLMGFAANDKGENVADLFRLNFNNSVFQEQSQGIMKGEKISLTKLASRKFSSEGNTHFRWGGGLFRSEKRKFILLACPEHIDPHSSVSLYSGFR